jgi:hypothetical protein
LGEEPDNIETESDVEGEEEEEEDEVVEAEDL